MFCTTKRDISCKYCKIIFAGATFYEEFSPVCAFNIFKQNTRGLYNRPIKGLIYFEKKTLANEIGTTTKNNLLRQKIFYRLFSLNIVIL